jgi:hypothetical protein
MMPLSPADEPKVIDALAVHARRAAGARLQLEIGRWRRRFARWLAIETRPGPYARLALALFLFLLSFSIKALHAVDLSPVMNTVNQPGKGMSAEYDRDAQIKLDGNGIFMPGNWDPSDTSLLARAPGYSIFLSAVYSLTASSYFYVQIVQNVVNSISPVLIFLIAGSLIGWRVGFASGALAAVSHHLSYHSNLVLPDSLAAFPVLLAVYVLVRARGRPAGTLAAYGLAGLLFGAATWLRPNLLLMGPLMAVIVTLASNRRGQAMRSAWLIGLVPFLVVAPITIRNYLIFHRLVPISENMGIVLWEGIGDAGGAGSGAPTSDREVAEQDAMTYGNPRYAESWASPDGITRDRDRIRRSIGVIARHPLWFAAAVTGRMKKMVSYVADADLIRKNPPAASQEPAQHFAGEPEKAARREHNALVQAVASRRTLAYGEAVWWARPVARSLERIAKETTTPLIFLGLFIVLVLAPRRALLLLGIPIYYLVVQSMMHFEFRYTLPMHYFLFVLAATVWVLILRGSWLMVKKTAALMTRRRRILC